MNVLVVAPHPDDEAIGCGGAILRHADRGDRVYVIFLTSGELALKHLDRDQARSTREREAQEAAVALGVADLSFLRGPDWGLADADPPDESVAALMKRVDPERVYTPHGGEWHPDHRAALAITRRAAVREGLPASSLLTYEVWTPLPDFDVIEDITALMPRKLDAIRCYPSQLTAFDYVQAATGLNGYRGALAARTAYAEVFDRCPEDTA